MRILVVAAIMMSLAFPAFHVKAADPDAQTIVKNMFDYYRGKASVATITMTIHRPDWERSMTMKARTKGDADSLILILAPPKDEGNGTLKKGREMWTFNPKVNRVIKLPPSMMSQAWLGSDFSNNDLAKSDTIIHDYVHSIIGEETHDGLKVYFIKSMPKPDAPVVWGMQKLKIREDNIPLEQLFFDEDLELVKSLTFDKIQMLGGRLYPKVMKMQKADTDGEYTLVEYDELEFKDDLPDRFFTLNALKNVKR